MKLPFALAASLLFAAPLYAEQQPVRILASLPITYGLGASLLAGSSVELQRAAPAKLPASRQISYFSGRGAKALAKVARQADGVIVLRSLWPDDPLYPMARRSNIRIVEVDGARPVDGALPGIAVEPGAADVLAAQPWLSITNLGRMADVTAADLVRLAPADKTKIEANLAELKQRLLKLSANSEGRLAELDNLTVASLSPHFAYLISGLNLDGVELEQPADQKWTPEALAQLTSSLQDDEVAVVLADRQPAAELAKAIADGGSHLLVLDSQGDDPVANLEATIAQLLDALAE